MEFIKVTRAEHKHIIPLLQDYFSLQGRTYTPRDIQDLLHDEIEQKGELFALKEGGQILGCISIVIKENKEAEFGYLAIGKAFYGKEYGEILLDHALEHCMRHEVTGISAMIPTMYESIFIRKGFLLHKDKIFVEWKKPDVDQQSSLKETFKDLGMVEDIVGMTAEKLRKLRTR